MMLTDIAGTAVSRRRRWACCRTILRASTVGYPREFLGNSGVDELRLAIGGWFCRLPEFLRQWNPSWTYYTSIIKTQEQQVITML